MQQRTVRCFFAWNYEKELKKINERSAAGFHMVRSSRLFRTEAEDHDRRYRYLVDCREKGGYTELLYEKQGWELVCRQGAFLYFRKEELPTRQETEYELHGDKRHAVQDHFHRIIKPLDFLRNLLLILAFILILIPGGLTNDLTPRIACAPLFLCLIPVKLAENLRKALGEHKRK